MSLPTPLASPSQIPVNLKLPPVFNFSKLPPQHKHGKTTKVQALFGILKEIDGLSKKKWIHFAAQLSMTRQINNLGNILHHLSKYNLSNLNTMTNAVSDDIYCFCRLVTLPKSFEYKTRRVSAYCWFIGILGDLKSNFDEMCALEMEYKLSSRGQDRLRIIQISVFKLIMDGVFCGCDVFNPSFRGVLQRWTGLFGGLLGSYKVYHRLQ